MNNLLRHIPSFLKNKYLIATAVFCVIILFLDKNDLFTQAERRKELRAMEQSKEYYSGALESERKALQALETNPSAVEKIARENYLMKRENEELFLVPEKPDNSKN